MYHHDWTAWFTHVKTTILDVEKRQIEAEKAREESEKRLEAKITAVLEYLFYTCPASGKCHNLANGTHCTTCQSVIDKKLI